MRRRHHRTNGSSLTALLLAALIISIIIATLCSKYNGINEATHMPPIEPNQLNSQTNRQLSMLNIASNFDDPKSIAYKPADSDSDEQSIVANAAAAVHPEEIKTHTYTDLINNAAILPKYSLKNVIEAANMYTSRYALLRYDPATDRFVAYYSNKHNWVSGCSKLAEAVRILTIILRNTLAERLTPDSGELVLAISGGDYPAIDPHKYGACLYKNEEKPCDESLLAEAPILHFGSVFSQPLFPNIIGMPMPRSHTDCFLNWLMSDKMPCQLFTPNQSSDETLPWDDLIPQLVWRGTDFRFLSIQNDLKRPEFNRHINGKTNPKTNQLKAAASILRDQYYRWLPRWKGVLYTAESEIEASRTGSLPKVNIKFSDVAEGGKHAAIGAKEYQEWEKIGFPVAGEHMDEAQLSKFKYHIDLGGGGGTTWTGFVRKLGMPGLLFHHVTATKDYIHDQTQPWVHYVPVQSDLSDLMEKMEWAETNQDEARLISERATALMKHISTSVGFEQIFDQHMLKPLIGVIDAYEPMNLKDDKAWDDAFEQLGGGDFYQFMECTREKGCLIGKPTLSWYKGS